MDFHITLRMALLTVETLVAEVGEDFVFQGSCVYVRDHNPAGIIEPACIVGQAFHKWGILRLLIGARDDLNALNVPVGTALEGQPYNGDDVCNLAGFNQDLRTYLGSQGVTLDDEAYAFLRRAQQVQDNRKPWSEALQDAAGTVLRSRGESTGTNVERLLD